MDFETSPFISPFHTYRLSMEWLISNVIQSIVCHSVSHWTLSSSLLHSLYKTPELPFTISLWFTLTDSINLPAFSAAKGGGQGSWGDMWLRLEEIWLFRGLCGNTKLSWGCPTESRVAQAWLSLAPEGPDCTFNTRPFNEDHRHALTVTTPNPAKSPCSIEIGHVSKVYKNSWT